MNHVSETIAQISPALLDVTGAPSADKPIGQQSPAEDQATEVEELQLAKPDTAERESATRAVGKLLGRAVKLKYRCSEIETQSDGEILTIDTYVEANKAEYWVSRRHATVLQMGFESRGDSSSFQVGSDGLPSVKELRLKAVEIIERQIPQFADLLSSLHPLEANNRRVIYYFRWEDLSKPLTEIELPPFVQVSLYADGALAGFADTISVGLTEKEICSVKELPDSWTKIKKT